MQSESTSAFNQDIGGWDTSPSYEYEVDVQEK